jgi:hypothetical protein
MGGSGGSISIAVMLANATVAAGTEARMDGDVLASESVNVMAKGVNTADADTLTVSIGIASGAGANANANVTADADVVATVASSASITRGWCRRRRRHLDQHRDRNVQGCSGCRVGGRDAADCR